MNTELAETAPRDKDPNALADAVGTLIRSWSETQDVAEQQATIDCLVVGLKSERRSARKLFSADLKGRSW